MLFQKTDVDYDNMDTDAYLGAAFEYNAAATKLQIDGNFTLNDTERDKFMSNVTDVKVMIIFYLISFTYMYKSFYRFTLTSYWRDNQLHLKKLWKSTRVFQIILALNQAVTAMPVRRVCNYCQSIL